MAKILVFNNDRDRMETYYRGEAEPVSYTHLMFLWTYMVL